MVQNLGHRFHFLRQGSGKEQRTRGWLSDVLAKAPPLAQIGMLSSKATFVKRTSGIYSRVPEKSKHPPILPARSAALRHAQSRRPAP